MVLGFVLTMFLDNGLDRGYRMQVWHLTSDAPRSPHRVSPGEPVTLHIGTWPIEQGQSVWMTYRVEHSDETAQEGRVEAFWRRNEGVNSYWHAEVAPFSKGDRVTYTVHGRSPQGEGVGPTASFRVGPKLYLAILWHQHQPVYKDTSHPTHKGSYTHPWVRPSRRRATPSRRAPTCHAPFCPSRSIDEVGRTARHNMGRSVLVQCLQEWYAK